MTRTDGRFVWPELLDLRPPAKERKQTTVVTLNVDFDRRDWVLAADFNLVERDRVSLRGAWILEVRVPGATDFEHDGAVALRMGLTGVTLKMIHDGCTWIEGNVDGEDLDRFRVPEPGWNQLKGAVPCQRCLNGSDHHLVVGEGKYIPKPNPELFDRLRGRRVEIVTRRGS